MSKIIFLNHYYWPDESATSQLLVDLAEHLALKDLDVVVVTSRHLYDGALTARPRKEDRRGVRIVRIWTSHFGRGSLVGRGLDYFTFYLFAFVALLSIVRPGDRIVAKTDPPLISVVAWFAARLKSASIVNWCQDLFPETVSALRVGWIADSLGHILRGLRNRSLRNAEMNVTISAPMRAALRLEGIAAEKIRAIHNWPDRCIVPRWSDQTELRRRWGIEDRFVIGYSGNLGRAHLPEQICELIERVKDMPCLTMLFIGGGHGMSRVRSLVEERGYSHALFKPYQPRDQLDRSLAVPDLHLISLHPRCEHYIMPSKYYGILAAGRPIGFIGSPSSAIGYEITQAKCGIVLDIGAAESWVAQIDRLRTDPDLVHAMQIRARQLYDQRFTQEAALHAWEEILLPSVQTHPNGTKIRQVVRQA